jgi:hypothetical protein
MAHSRAEHDWNVSHVVEHETLYPQRCCSAMRGQHKVFRMFSRDCRTKGARVLSKCANSRAPSSAARDKYFGIGYRTMIKYK